ncbi:37s ribosomal protein mitochondrial [Colletotrichum musicola]|uniref:Small ribosomal subunit protein mS37 n=2 Tax=Colletotrichum orchidearum species complex TaxID=2707337 RepID=A0A8H6NHY8_9PEZI|nr:37s ribosomal protein mitochondrial [Colletotrichum plurivorum]KAF6833131.1 37s ribosomal protein mitochondrial [Colletotrichum musicola]
MAKKPVRLPPVKVLRVKNPNKQPPNPCIQLMSSVLACWASAGYNTQGCAALENALRKCMDKPEPPKEVGSPINYHLNRMRDRVVFQKKDVKPTKDNQ